MRVKSVPSSWIRREDKRLDVGPYMSGALEAKMRLADLPVQKDRLGDLVLNGDAGIYHAGREGRVWVNDPKHGVPFLGSTDIMKADLSHLPLISRMQVLKTPKFLIHRGWTLITRSGTIGRVAYARREMNGMACSEHVMRVVPDSEMILPGYLYAYLAGKFGVTLIVAGTYGAIVQHIEPHHISNLPVPRLGDDVEQQAHQLIEEAAQLRGEASMRRRRAVKRLEAQLDWNPDSLHELTSSVCSSLLRRRMDAFHHSAYVIAARNILRSTQPRTRIGDVVEEVFEPPRCARVKVEDSAYGIPFLSFSQVFRLDPTGEYLVSARKTPHLFRQLVEGRDLLLPRSGQLGGIIGRATLPLPTYYGDAASEHLVRIRCRSQEDALFLWAVLASQPGYYASIGTAYGSSIPSLDCSLLADLEVPWWEGRERADLVALVQENVKSLTRAIHAEREAIAIVERAIEDAT